VAELWTPPQDALRYYGEVSFGSYHLCKTGFWHRIASIGPGFSRRFHIVAAILRPGGVIEVGLVYLLGGNLFAGVTGDLSHNGNHCTSGHIVAVIDGGAFANGCKEDVVLSLIRVASSLPAPVCLAPDSTPHNVGLTLAAQDNTGRIVVASVRRTTKSVDGDAIGEFVNDGMMVEHIAIDGLCH